MVNPTRAIVFQNDDGGPDEVTLGVDKVANAATF